MTKKSKIGEKTRGTSTTVAPTGEVVTSVVWKNPPRPNKYVALFDFCVLERSELNERLIPLIKEMIRLNEMLPLWARSGPTSAHPGGSFSGFSTYPMMKDDIPSERDRFSCTIRYDENFLMDRLESGHIGLAVYRKQQAALEERVRAQRDEKRKIGIDLVEADVDFLETQIQRYGELMPGVESLYTKWHETENQFARAELEEAILTLDVGCDDEYALKIEVLEFIAANEPERLVKAVKLMKRPVGSGAQEAAMAA